VEAVGTCSVARRILRVMNAFYASVVIALFLSTNVAIGIIFVVAIGGLVPTQSTALHLRGLGLFRLLSQLG